MQHLNSRQMLKECDLEMQGLLSLLQTRVISHEQTIYQQRIVAIMQIVFLIE